MSDVMSVYRKQEGGAVFNYSIRREIRHAYHCREIYKVFGEEYKKLSKHFFTEYGVEAFMNARGNHQYKWNLLFDLLRFNFCPSIKAFTSFFSVSSL